MMTSMDNTDSDTESEETRCHVISHLVLKAIRRFITFLFSHVGLTCLVAAYAFLGGMLFKAVEHPREQEVRDLMTGTKDACLDKIVDVYDGPNELLTVNKPEWNKIVDQVLRDFERDIHVATQEKDWDGAFGEEEFQWSFANSLLYSVTVITTIGYGNITPKTTCGRLVTIVYGILGIPITMLCLRNIGNLLAGIFRLIYRMACVNVTYQYIKLKRKRLRKRFTKRVHHKTKILRHWASQKQSMMTSLIHTKIGSSRNGSNASLDEFRASTHERIAPKSATSMSVDSVLNDQSVAEDVKVEVHTNAGMPGNTTETTSNCTSTRCRSFKTGIHHCDKKAADTTTQRQRSQSVSGYRPPSWIEQSRKPSLTTCNSHSRNEISRTTRQSDTSHHFTNDLCIIPEDSEEEVRFDNIKAINEEAIAEHSDPSSSISTLCLEDFKEDELMLKARLKSTRDLVPISVCLLLVTGYIIFGAIIFTPWEENWDFLVGFYFCFITLTTIGFGDFVPGMGSSRWGSDEKRIFCVVYLLLGMALLAMCFHLIQEEVRHKCRKMAVRIGLIEEKLTRLLDTYTQDG